jgi:hypothetical protein
MFRAKRSVHRRKMMMMMTMTAPSPPELVFIGKRQGVSARAD